MAFQNLLGNKRRLCTYMNYRSHDSVYILLSLEIYIAYLLPYLELCLRPFRILLLIFSSKIFQGLSSRIKFLHSAVNIDLYCLVTSFPGLCLRPFRIPFTFTFSCKIFQDQPFEGFIFQDLSLKWDNVIFANGVYDPKMG